MNTIKVNSEKFIDYIDCYRYVESTKNNYNYWESGYISPKNNFHWFENIKEFKHYSPIFEYDYSHYLKKNIGRASYLINNNNCFKNNFFIFEFESEEDALYFKLKFCLD